MVQEAAVAYPPLEVANPPGSVVQALGILSLLQMREGVFVGVLPDER